MCDNGIKSAGKMHTFWVMDIRLPFALCTCIASLLKIVIFMAAPVLKHRLLQEAFGVTRMSLLQGYILAEEPSSLRQAVHFN